MKNSTYDASVAVSFMELYNEELVDLLNPRPKSASATASGGPTLREDGTGKIFWVNLSEEKVSSTAELLSVLQKGTLCRTTGSTDMNASSSRSHAIFTVTLKQSFVPLEEPSKEEGEQQAPTDQDQSSSSSSLKTSLISKFHFVDLAGSERLKRTNAEGDRKKEGISINQGLLALGNVISALGDETRKAAHIPYRDSKLTRMLQDSLGGNSQTLMLACISPSDLNYGETVNTLQYANRARNIKNRVAINQDWGNSSGEAQRELRSLRQTISQLRTEIAMIRAGGVELREVEGIENANPALGSIVGQTKLHFHQRRERDQLAEIERLKAENANNSFQLDQFHFLSIRLAKQVRQLMEENAKIAIQRDSAVAEKCLMLDPKTRFGQSEKKVKTSREPSPASQKRGRQDENDVHPIIKGYIHSISQLRLQLADCEDKLAWQYEAMSKLGQKGSKANLAWSLQSLKDLNISTSPTQKRIEQIATTDGHSGEISGERNLLEAIRENIELNEATKRNDYSLISGSNSFIKDLVNGSSATDLSHQHSLLQNEMTELDIDDLNDKDADEPEERTHQRPHTADQQGPDIYMLINKLQNDIVQHEALAESIQKREAEYNRMQKAYESKLSVLQNQMSQIQKERDLALTKMTNSSKQQRSDVKSKFEERQRRLDSEISDTRRKMGENSRLQSNSKSRAEKLTSELQATISALKSEKMRMLQELRTQTQKHRDSNNANMREISKLRRKEKATSDIAKRLERSNQLQRLMLKKRNQEVVQTQQKLKQIMQSLKRASTPNKVIKSHSSGFSSPAPRNIKTAAKGRTSALSGPAMNEILASVNSPVRVSVSQSLMDARPDIDIKAQFKKQMVDKELNATVSCRKTQKTLQKLQRVRNRLIEEQKELIAERKRVVEANYRESGVFDEKSPQYMDDRVQSIDNEVASIDTSMTELENSLKMNSGVLDSGFIGENVNNAVDLNWDNALNILRSLDRIELEATLAYFLEDLVSLRTVQDEVAQELEAKEQATANLKQQLQDLQESLFSQMKKTRVVNFADEIPNDGYPQSIGDTLAMGIGSDPLDIDDLDEKSLSSQTPLPRLDEDSLHIPLAIRIPSPSRKNGMRPIAISPSPKLEDDLALFRGRPSSITKDTAFSSITKDAAFSSFKKDRPLSPIKESSRPGSASAKEKEEDPNLSSHSLQTIQLDNDEPKAKKRYDLLSFGGAGDVFKRLANAHTQASQAKVIQRTAAVDRDALMQDPNATAEVPAARKKSLTEMENAWNE